jgi:hypothetical protein
MCGQAHLALRAAMVLFAFNLGDKRRRERGLEWRVCASHKLRFSQMEALNLNLILLTPTSCLSPSVPH